MAACCSTPFWWADKTQSFRLYYSVFTVKKRGADLKRHYYAIQSPPAPAAPVIFQQNMKTLVITLANIAATVIIFGVFCCLQNMTCDYFSHLNRRLMLVFFVVWTVSQLKHEATIVLVRLLLFFLYLVLTWQQRHSPLHVYAMLHLFADASAMNALSQSVSESNCPVFTATVWLCLRACVCV